MFASDKPSGDDPLIGPVDLDWARNCLRGLSTQSFLSRYKVPSLILSLSKGAPAIETSGSFGLTRRAINKKQANIQAGITLITKRKKEPNNKSKKISLGRSSACDIVVKIATLSKVHCLFEDVDGDWVVMDNGSTNGTLIGNNRLDSGEPYMLASGDTIYLGPDISALFLMPKDLVHYILS